MQAKCVKGEEKRKNKHHMIWECARMKKKSKRIKGGSGDDDDDGYDRKKHEPNKNKEKHIKFGMDLRIYGARIFE